MPEPRLAKESPCGEKARMFEEVQRAIAVITALNTKELDIVFTGDDALIDSIAAELRLARERKDALIFVYRNHVQRHGC